MADRLKLPALLNRLICGSATTFHRADAVNALALVPQQRAGWFAFQATGTGSSRPMEGTAASVGNAGIEERRNFRFATDDAVGVRAVQWKVTRELERAGQESSTIEQVKAGEMEGGAPPRSFTMRASRPRCCFSHKRLCRCRLAGAGARASGGPRLDSAPSCPGSRLMPRHGTTMPRIGVQVGRNLAHITPGIIVMRAEVPYFWLDWSSAEVARRDG